MNNLIMCAEFKKRHKLIQYIVLKLMVMSMNLYIYIYMYILHKNTENMIKKNRINA